MYRFLEDLLIEAAEAVKPPERLSVNESAVRHRYIRNTGSYIGPWDPTIAPYLEEVMAQFNSTEFESVIFVGPARCGKTDPVINWGIHSAIDDPADLMIVHMSESTGRNWSKSDLAKALRHSKDFGAALRPGGRFDNVLDKEFKSGARLTIAYPTINELSGKTVPRCWLTDYDRMPDDVDGEGSAFFLTLKRNESVGRFGMTVCESSPGREVISNRWIPSTPHEAPPVSGGILPLYNRGDRRRFYWQCIACDIAFEPDFKHLDYPNSADKLEAAEQATLLCPHCRHRYWFKPKEQGGSGPSRNEMNQLLEWGGHATWLRDGQFLTPDGKILGTPRRSKSASFWLKGPCAVFSSWEKLVFNYLSALEEYEKSGSEENLKTTINVDQGNAYTPKSIESERVPDVLKQRAKDHGLRVVPLPVRFLLATIDVQKHRFVVQVQGIGVGGDIYVIDRFDIRKSERFDDQGDRLRVDPGAYHEDWHLLINEVLKKTYPLADGSGRHMKILRTFCDSGGREGVTPKAYAFYRFLRDGPEKKAEGEEPSGWVDGLVGRFTLIKGIPNPSAPRVALRYPDSQRKDRFAEARGEIPVLELQSNKLKDQLDGLLDRVDPQGGMIHFPDWLPENFYIELTVETRNEKGEWENKNRKRNESWDLLYYCLGGMTWSEIGVEHIEWLDPPTWAAEWDENDLIFEPEIEDNPFKREDTARIDFSALGKNLG